MFIGQRNMNSTWTNVMVRSQGRIEHHLSSRQSSELLFRQLFFAMASLTVYAQLSSYIQLRSRVERMVACWPWVWLVVHTRSRTKGSKYPNSRLIDERVANYREFLLRNSDVPILDRSLEFALRIFLIYTVTMLLSFVHQPVVTLVIVLKCFEFLNGIRDQMGCATSALARQESMTHLTYWDTAMLRELESNLSEWQPTTSYKLTTSPHVVAEAYFWR